ncbi:MAG TPA: PD-(D/E)XK nuclease domain-containing protein, partial [Aquella sp.]|nr:PD-(D/E)XK nuclease domain-containing protein [Aquella sp.]
NLEVKASLNNQLAILGSTVEAKNTSLNNLTDYLTNNEINKLADVFTSHFAGIPHDWYRNNDIEHYEGFYASIVYSYFCALGYTVIAEDATNVGKIDLTIKLPDKILILEFKLKKNGNAKSALQQIKDKGYAAKYVNLNIPIYLIGMSFDPTTKNVYDIITDIN